MEDLKSKLLQIMDNHSDKKTWYTLKDLEGLTGSSSSEIITVINTNEEFVKSTHLSEDHLSRYSTREEFNRSVSFMDKLKGAFKNTID